VKKVWWIDPWFRKKVDEGGEEGEEDEEEEEEREEEALIVQDRRDFAD
jgi:hypothetical protein